jgi:cytochrome c oxidase accessory protein FixG
MKIKRIQPWRRFAEAVQAVIIIGLPFLKINGESALRFDVPTLRLHFFGTSIWMEEFFIVLVAVMFLTLLIAFITLMFGRIWCGWLCPQTVIIDFTRFVDKMKSKGLLYKAGVLSLTFLISIIVAANLIWYFVSPYEFIPQVMEGSLGTVTTGFWIVLTGLIFLNFLLLRHKFCATVCPYAKLQGVMFDNKTLVISFDPRRKEECMKCMACVRTCPVGIDIREGLSSACINCAECVDACTEMMEHRQKKSLIGYFFGLPGGTWRLLRQNAVITGSAAGAFLVFLLFLSFSRVSIDMTILPNYASPPRITVEKTAVNSYILSVKNTGKSDAELSVKAGGADEAVKVLPDKILLKAGEYKKVTVYVFVKNFGNKSLTKMIDISIASGETNKIMVTRKASFIIPEA